MSGLNDAQNRAVHCDGHSLLVAIPGSGKTRVLQEKTVHLLKKNPSDTVVACTFTRDAADEIRQRILVAYPQAESRLLVGTFHSLCLMQLKNASKKFKIVTDAEQRHMLKQALAKVDMRVSFSDAVGIVDYFKSRDAALHKSEEGYSLYLAYQDVLERHQAYDFSDIIINCVNGMKDGTVEPLKPNYLLVDEFQDTDLVQLDWVLTHINLSNGRMKSCLCGDDDQSIYGWRAATGYQGMMDYRKSTNAELITMDINYRSKSEILRHASYLIKHNRNRIEKELKSYRGPGGKVSALEFQSLEQEIVGAVGCISSGPDDWSVLARTNGHLDLVEAELTKNNIPYTRNESGSFWLLDAVHTYISLIESLAKGSEVGVEKAMLLCGLGRKQIEQIKLGDNLLNIVREPEVRLPRMTVEQRDNITVFCNMFCRWNSFHCQRRYQLVLLGVMQWLTMNCSMKEKDVENIKIAHQILYEKSGTLMQRLNAIKSLNQKSDKTSGVSLLTLHSSKGLEFPKVWLLHANENTMPHKDSLEEVEEERRLFYVGMTRAKDELYVSYSIGEDDEKSRFLTESQLLVEQ